MTLTVKLVGIAHSKLRNSIGAVGIEVNPVKQEILIKMVKRWPRDKINDIAPDIAVMYQKFEWSNTIIDMAVGEHLIQDFRRTSKLPIKIILIRKKLADGSEIRRVKKIDLIEMVQFMLQQKLIHKIKFPKNPSPEVKELEDQIALYAEKSTEKGGMDYYAPGEELDDLTKGLMLAVFAARPFMMDSTKIIGGPLRIKPPTIENMASIIEDRPIKTIKRKRIRGI